MTITRKKLIEVALPLEAINKASAREKSIRHGHPSTLHLWWARRPLAAARAVIFAQMVDDPSGCPELFPTPEEQQRERQRLFELLERLVLWENSTNEDVLQEARNEIWKSWKRTCADNREHPRAAELFDPEKLPAFHDPFAGGGALPLEAQRLGLESYASDLNPVAVLINKAMIEIPPLFAGRPPVNPEARNDTKLFASEWRGAKGLAEDVRYYGKWMRDEAEKRIGHLYPKAKITPEMVKERPDLKQYEGRELTVIAWLWARTVKSPNPAFADVDVPLVSNFMLCTKEGKEAYVEPVIEGNGYRFTVKTGKPKDAEAARNGTKLARGANFRCIMSDAAIPGDYIKAEGKAGRMGARLMAIVADGDRGRVYLSALPEHEHIASVAQPKWRPEGLVPARLTGGTCVPYGLKAWGDLFTPRQLLALTTFSELVGEMIKRVWLDVEDACGVEEGSRKDTGLHDVVSGSLAYGEAVGVYLAFAVDKGANYWSSLCAWHTGAEKMISTFGRQAIPMVWDFSEANPLSDSSGNFLLGVEQAAKMNETIGRGISGKAMQVDAAKQSLSLKKIVSTDPPYFDNIGYADLSDFFYVWLRRSLSGVFSDLFSTMSTPKAEELVATPYRHGSKAKADLFFLEGMTKAMARLVDQAHPVFPVTIYYAFKQSEHKDDTGIFSTGWESFLDAVNRVGFSVSGTWPVRTEYTGNLKKNVGALASSIVLVCRKRPAAAPSATRRELLAALSREIPPALRLLQSGNIAPVDLAQAAIGPGMAVFTRYSKVLDAQGQPVSVRDALALINRILDETLAEQEGEFDAASRWAVAWFDQHGFGEGDFGDAETLSKAKNVSVQGLVEASMLESRRGVVRLLPPGELPEAWEPKPGVSTAWETVHHLVRVLESGGESGAALLAAKAGSAAEEARNLAYRLYTICERRKRPSEGLAYNALVQSWPEILRLARETASPQGAGQGRLNFESEV